MKKKTYRALSMTEQIAIQQINADLLTELKAARRAIRAIKREQGKWDYGRVLCIKADKRATLAIKNAEPAS